MASAPPRVQALMAGLASLLAMPAPHRQDLEALLMEACAAAYAAQAKRDRLERETAGSVTAALAAACRECDELRALMAAVRAHLP